jgi:hypothetical protein
MNGKDTVIIICHKVISTDMTLFCAKKVSSLFCNDGHVKHSKCNDSFRANSLVVMFEWKYAQKYGRYIYEFFRAHMMRVI